MSSIVLLPASTWPDRPALLTALRTALAQSQGTGLIDLDLPAGSSLAAQACAELLRTRPRPGPITIVAGGEGAALAPQVALALRAARRVIEQYVLIAPIAEPTGTDWPDAPVAVFTDDAELARRCTLRGWQVGELPSIEECARWLCARPA